MAIKIAVLQSIWRHTNYFFLAAVFFGVFLAFLAAGFLAAGFLAGFLVFLADEAFLAAGFFFFGVLFLAAVFFFGVPLFLAVERLKSNVIPYFHQLVLPQV